MLGQAVIPGSNGKRQLPVEADAPAFANAIAIRLKSGVRAFRIRLGLWAPTPYKGRKSIGALRAYCVSGGPRMDVAVFARPAASFGRI